MAPSGGSAAVPDHLSMLPAVLRADPPLTPDSAHLPRSTRDWIVDVAAFLVAIAVGAIVVLISSGSQSNRPVLIADLACGAVACLALWLRRRWPAGVAVALVPLAAFSAAATGATGIALFNVAVHRRLPLVAAVGLLQTLAAFVYWVLRDTKAPSVWVSLSITLGIAVLANVALIAWGMFVRARRQLVMSLQERALRAESEQQLRVEQARHLERTRIAREMHDVLAHRISLVSLHAGALEFRPDASPEEITRAAGVIRSSAHQALEDLRKVIGVLRTGPGGELPERPQPTLSDLPPLLDEARRAGMHVQLLRTPEDLAAVPAEIGRDAYRIVQEGLTNARKHAPGSAVEVKVHGTPDGGLTIEIRNPLPINVEAVSDIPGAGMGIVGLMERAALAGGRLESGATLTDEFRLWAWLPWPR